jgi:aspartate kinase
MIIQNISEDGYTDISFTCPKADLDRARETLDRIVPELNAREYVIDTNIAKVSLVGTGMKSSPGVAALAFSTLGENNINILAISTSPIRLSVVVEKSQATEAVRCLHHAFGLDSDSVFEETQLSAEEVAAKMAKGRYSRTPHRTWQRNLRKPAWTTFWSHSAITPIRVLRCAPSSRMRCA